MSNDKLATVNTDEKPVMFTPLGSADAIKLSVIIIQKLVATRTKRGHTCSREDATRFLMMCQARRLNPFEGDAYLVGYDSEDGPKFSLITSHQAFLKRGELAQGFQGMDSGTIVKEKLEDFGDEEAQIDPNRFNPGVILANGEFQWRLQRGDFFVPGQEVVGGWATVYAEGKSIPWHRRLRVERFDTGKAQWAKDKAGMIVKCAEADALRCAFPTQCAGMRMEGEVDTKSLGEVIDLGPAASRLVEDKPTASPEGASSAAGPENSSMADEKAEAEAGLAPASGQERPAKAAPVGEQRSPQRQLEALMGEVGFNFEMFRKWAGTSAAGISDADSLENWDAVRTNDAQRLCRAMQGQRSRPAMLQELERIK